MRRMVSFGGGSGVPGSQRLKHKLSLTPGLHLLSGNPVEDGGFLAALEESQDGRVIHKTSWATRNFFTTASALKKVSKRESPSIQKGPFAPGVKERTIFDEPIEVEQQLGHDARSLLIGEENHSKDLDARSVDGARVHNGATEGEVGNASQVALISPSRITPKPEETDVDKAAEATSLNFPKSVPFDSEKGLHQHSDVLQSGAVTNGRKGGTDPSKDDASEERFLVGRIFEDSDGVPGPRGACLLKPSDDQECGVGAFGNTILVVGKLHGGQPSEPGVKAVVRSFISNNSSAPDENDSRGAESADNVEIDDKDGLYLQKSSASVADPREDSTSVKYRNAAALEIQRYCRGWLQRRCFMQTKGRVVIVQSLVRRNQESKKYQKLLNAAIVVQKNWRAFQSMRLVKHLKVEQALMEQQIKVNAATMLQKHWRAVQSRELVRHLKMERSARAQETNVYAAVVLQKNWRATQCRSLVKHLKMEEIVKEQQRIDSAAIVLQKHWRALEGRRLTRSLKMEKDQQSADSAAIVLQKYWRAFQCRRLVKQLKMEQLVMEQQRVNSAAIVLQNHWWALKQRRLVKYLKMEQVVREQQRVNSAAIVLQKHWRALECRRLVKYLKMEQVVREQQRVNSAAIMLQKHWRASECRRLVKLLKMEHVVREQQRVDNAAVLLQKHWRALQSRRFVKSLKMEQVVKGQEQVDAAAIVVQKAWRAFGCRRLVKYLKMEQVVKEQQKVGNAAVALQKHWRALQSRLLRKHLKMQEVVREQHRVEVAAINLQKHWRGLQGRRLVKFLKMEQTVWENRGVENATIVLQKHWRVVQSRCLVKRLKMEQAASEQQIVEDAGGPSFCQALIGFTPVTTTEKLHLQTNVGEEDWNYVAVDHLDECLDTCLAVLRPLPSSLAAPSSVAGQCLLKLEAPDGPQQQMCTSNQVMHSNSATSTKTDDKTSAPSEFHTSACTWEQLSSTSFDVGESQDDHCSALLSSSKSSRAQSDGDTSRDHNSSKATGVLAPTDMNDTSAVQQEACTYQVGHKEGLRNGQSHKSRTLNQNEKRLQQFAQVFLLQRHIALQQQRAQAAPPFPPTMPSGSSLPCHFSTRSVDVGASDLYFPGARGAIAAQNMHAHYNPSCVTAVRQVEQDVGGEAENCGDLLALHQNPPSNQNDAVAGKQVTARPGTDVVLDMVLLLRKIEKEYGTSDTGSEGESSTCFPSRCGDIEEGLPLLGNNVRSVQRQNSLVEFANAVSLKRISIPDVNAVLLVLIAMVVYTRTICRGVFFGTRQTDRKV